MKFIRESRMGPPKSFKTGAVVGTYPKPLLYLGFDRGGIDVIPRRDANKGAIPLDVCWEDIEHYPPSDISEPLSKEKSAQPKVLAIDFCVQGTTDISLEFKPAPMSKPFGEFTTAYNKISAHLRAGRPLPWSTVVFDSLTGFEDIVLNHISSHNPVALSDPRVWASQVGGKVRQTILSLTTWPCHVVVLLHTVLDKNELTGTITEIPSVFSAGLRADINGLFSQVFYATKDNGKPVVWTTDRQFVRGIGPRFPAKIDAICAPDFTSIYGKETEQ